MNLIKSTLGEAGIENQASWSPLNPVRLKFASTNSNWIPANVVNGCNSSEKRRIICKRSQFREIRTNTRWQEKKWRKPEYKRRQQKKTNGKCELAQKGEAGRGRGGGGGRRLELPYAVKSEPSAASLCYGGFNAPLVSPCNFRFSIHSFKFRWELPVDVKLGWSASSQSGKYQPSNNEMTN